MIQQIPKPVHVSMSEPVHFPLCSLIINGAVYPHRIPAITVMRGIYLY